jgi:hypothetical protein
MSLAALAQSNDGMKQNHPYQIKDDMKHDEKLNQN